MSVGWVGVGVGEREVTVGRCVGALPATLLPLATFSGQRSSGQSWPPWIHPLSNYLRTASRLSLPARPSRPAPPPPLRYLAHGTATDYMFTTLGVPLALTWEIYGDWGAGEPRPGAAGMAGRSPAPAEGSPGERGKHALITSRKP